MRFLPFIFSLILSPLITGCFGFIIGFPALRVSGMYLGLTTMGFGFIIRRLIIALREWTQGSAGLVVSPPEIFSFTIKGDWANYFDGPTARQFHRRFGRYLRAWGYEPNGLWAEKHNLEQKPKSNGQLFASLLHLQQMTDKYNKSCHPARFNHEQQIKNLFQSKPRIDLN